MDVLDAKEEIKKTEALIVSWLNELERHLGIPIKTVVVHPGVAGKQGKRWICKIHAELGSSDD